MMMNFTLSNQVQIPAVGTFMMTPDQAEQAVVDALACGYRMIDTAQAYMNERAVGRGIKRSGVAREDIFISTKIWVSQYLTEGTVEKSLELLGTDYIDLMFIHQPAGDFMAGYRKLEKAYKEGKIKSIGISNFQIGDIESLMETAEIKPMVNQILLHISNTPLELVGYCQKNGIVVEVYSPNGHGEILNQPEIKEMAEKYGVSVPQLCIRYTLQLGTISLPKTANPDHMKANAEVDFEISPEDMEILKNFKKIESYGASSGFPVYGGKL